MYHLSPWSWTSPLSLLEHQGVIAVIETVTMKQNNIRVGRRADVIRW
jgi:hypothetical protein